MHREVQCHHEMMLYREKEQESEQILPLTFSTTALTMHKTNVKLVGEYNCIHIRFQQLSDLLMSGILFHTSKLG